MMCNFSSGPSPCSALPLVDMLPDRSENESSEIGPSFTVTMSINILGTNIHRCYLSKEVD